MALDTEGVQDGAVPIVSKILDTVGTDGDLFKVSWLPIVSRTLSGFKGSWLPIVSKWGRLGVDLGPTWGRLGPNLGLTLG